MPAHRDMQKHNQVIADDDTFARPAYTTSFRPPAYEPVPPEIFAAQAKVAAAQRQA